MKDLRGRNLGMDRATHDAWGHVAWARVRRWAVLGVAGLPLWLGAEEVLTLEAFEVVGRYLYTDQVNALRTPTPVLDVPQSLTILTAAEIEARGLSSLGEMVDYTPGVNTSQGEGHRDAIVFRGVRTTADFYLDGVRDDVQYYRPLYNLEQVELLRGPNALLFGRGGAGGILNRVTKKGILGERFGGYSATVDTFGEVLLQFDTNTPLGEEAAVRLNVMHEQLSNHRDQYDGERFGFNPTLKWRAGPATMVDVAYEFIDHERIIDRGVPTGIDGRPVRAFRKVVFGDPLENFAELKAHLFRVSAQHVISDTLKVNVSANYGDYDKLYQNIYTTAYDQALTPDLVTLDGYVDATLRRNLILSANVIGEMDAGTVRHTFIAGLEFIDTQSDQYRYDSFWDTTMGDKEVFRIERPMALRGGVGVNAAGEPTRNRFSVDLADDTRVGVDVMSLYLQDEIGLSENWQAIIGARFDRFDIEVDSVPANERRSRVDEEVSPRLGIIYKPADNMSVYTSYSQTFLPRSGEQFDNINGDREKLDPDTYSNMEVGIKMDFNQALSWTLAVFEVEKSSPQMADSDPSTLDIIDSRIRGAEAQVLGSINDRWFVSAGYSYLTGEQVNRAGATGLRPIELPRQMASIWTKYSFTERFAVALGIKHQDDTFINNANTALLPAYTRVDAALYYKVRDDLRLQVHIENLTDTLYFPNAHSTHEATVGAPINARLAVIGRF